MKPGIVTASGVADEERVARLRVEAYVARVYDQPLNDDRKLSIRGATSAMGMSPNTLYKYGLDKRLAAAASYRSTRRAEAGIERGSATAKALSLLRAERDQWKKQYEDLLEAHVHLQYALRLEPGVDMERVLLRRLPKAVRNAPGRGRRMARQGRGGFSI